jgi:hypothetical protein
LTDDAPDDPAAVEERMRALLGDFYMPEQIAAGGVYAPRAGGRPLVVRRPDDGTGHALVATLHTDGSLSRQGRSSACDWSPRSCTATWQPPRTASSSRSWPAANFSGGA